METDGLRDDLVIPVQPETSARSRFDEWMAVEKCLPGVMQLVPVYVAGGRIVDLICTAASHSVAQLLSDRLTQPVGKRLSLLLSQHAQADALLGIYISVIKTGEPRRFQAARDSGERLQHCVLLEQPGIVCAELRNESAFERAQAAHGHPSAQEAGEPR